MLATTVLGVSSCGDGTPGFCEPLAESADLSGLATAIEAGDLDTAGAEAERLSDLADSAPAEIRDDFDELIDAVVDVIELLESTAATDGPGAGTGDLERQRDDLNARLGELGTSSDRVAAWASAQCGIDLTN